MATNRNSFWLGLCKGVLIMWIIFFHALDCLVKFIWVAVVLLRVKWTIVVICVGKVIFIPAILMIWFLRAFPKRESSSIWRPVLLKVLKYSLSSRSPRLSLARIATDWFRLLGFNMRRWSHWHDDWVWICKTWRKYAIFTLHW